MKDLVCPYCGFEQDVKNVSVPKITPARFGTIKI